MSFYRSQRLREFYCIHNDEPRTRRLVTVNGLEYVNPPKSPGMMVGRADYLGLRLDEVLKIHSSIKLQVGKHDEPGLLVIESLRGISTALLEAQATPTHGKITEVLWVHAFMNASVETGWFDELSSTTELQKDCLQCWQLFRLYQWPSVGEWYSWFDNRKRHRMSRQAHSLSRIVPTQ